MATNDFKIAQLQNFSLGGAGAIAGATQILLKSFLDIDGNDLAMTDFGAVGYGTLEPGNGEQEEQISFTGVTQETNGTAALTGVKSVTFLYPYTETSGLLKTHAGSVTFVISNTSGFYNKFVAKDDDGTITGLLTFPNGANTPVLGGSYVAPTIQTQVASKGYVDATASAGAANATTSVQGLVQLPTQAQVDAKTAVGSTGASLAITPALQRSTLESDYVIDTGAANAYVITPSPAITAYTTGQIFTWKSTNTNTTTSTLAVNGLTAKTIKKKDGATNLQAGDIVSGQMIQVEYDGTNFQMINPSALTLPAISSSNINQFVGTTNGTAFAFGVPFDYQAFTGSGTWTKPTNLTGNEMVVVQVWGAGGGGGGVLAGAGNNGGGGGGGGSFVESHFRASDLGSTVTVTIGAGGAGGAAGANNGVAGGNTTFGSLATAYGGGLGIAGDANGNTNGGGGGGAGNIAVGANGSGTSGGAGGGFGGGAANTATTNSDGGGGGGNSGNSGGASFNGGGGGAGGATSDFAGSASINGGGGGAAGAASGGTSIYGGAGGAGALNGAGSAGSAPGGGGGSPRVSNSTSKAGGAGAAGACRVWTFY